MRPLISVMMGPSSRSFLMASHQESGVRKREEKEPPRAELPCQIGVFGSRATGKGLEAILLLGQ